MKFYRDHHPNDFRECEATIRFIERIAQLVHAFESRSGKNGLRKPSPERTVKHYLLTFSLSFRAVILC